MHRLTIGYSSLLAVVAVTCGLGCSESSSADDTSNIADASSEKSKDVKESSVDAPVVDVSGQDTSSDVLTERDTAKQDTAVEDTAADDTMMEDTSTQDTAAEDTATEDTAKQDTATEDTATEDTAMQDVAPDVIENKSTAQVVMGSDHSCALRTDGKVLCWGDNLRGQIGQGNYRPNDYWVPTVVPGLDAIEQLAVGTGFTCAKSHSGKVFCWGNNHKGQLGLSATLASKFSPTELDKLGDVKHLAAGSSHACVCKSDGKVWCWGNNIDGRLGDGTTIDRPTPVLVSDLDNAEEVVLGVNHSCAITTLRQLYCWGSNSYGQLGQGDKKVRYTPTKVAISGKVVRVALGGYFGCVQTEDSSLYCFGSNKHGQQGKASLGSNILSPTKVTTPTGVKGFSTGLNHSCYFDMTGKVYCVGANTTGQIGDGTNENRADWTAILDKGAIQTSLGWLTSAVLTQTDTTLTAYAWGDNAQGQLGDGTSTPSNKPKPIAGITF